MSPKRSYPSGCEKRKKKQRVEQLAESQRGDINKFFVSDRQAEQSVEDLENDEFETLVNNEYKNLMDEQEGNGDIRNGEANQGDKINVECDHSNIDDPGNWKYIDQKLRDLLVERGPVTRNCDVNFPKDGSFRHFSSVHYVRHLSNGEKVDRKWLIYSEVLKLMENCYPNSWIAYRILLTIPVTVASGERSFSKLKMIKNYLRSTMSHERLNGLEMLSIENDFAGKLDYVSLIDLFASKNARRAMFK
ncbi:uncharacterized protein LOC130796584 [Actinidia eriantha]|uniref:uncharacterized protein LOC130796584 n=1 Tax=Actinidia eriantha TaxID=165200 RepID=UPI0025836BBA|nr:uncharacterized protein LOC130796584 [Actinidia eriantha]